MYQYKYVTVGCSKWIGAEFTIHREIIDQHASEGWRYVGYVPSVINDYGKFKEIDLIFEKEI